jgi:probable HAF family extracellular repeat protein
MFHSQRIACLSLAFVLYAVAVWAQKHSQFQDSRPLSRFDPRLAALGKKPQTRGTPHTVRYTITDLGVLGQGDFSNGLDMNNEGWVTGSSNLTPGGVTQHGFIWFGRGPLVDVGTLGGPNSEAGGPNAFGEAALISETAGPDPDQEDFCEFGTYLKCLGSVWLGGRQFALPTLPGGNNAQAYGVNDLGEVVGFSENGTLDAACAKATTSIDGTTGMQQHRFEGVKWEPGGTIVPLLPLAGDTVTFAFGINNQGQSVGTSGTCENVSLPWTNPNGPHAVLWDRNGNPTDLGNLGSGDSNIGSAINSQGDVSGNAGFPDGTHHGFLWTRKSGIKDITVNQPAFADSFATIVPCCNTVNDKDQVVGWAIDPSESGPPYFRAFIWENGVMTDLNTLIAADSPWYLQAAQAINNAGEITGYGLINGEVHTFLATPHK